MHRKILKVLMSLFILVSVSTADSYYKSNFNNIDRAVINLSNKLLSSCRVNQNSLEDIAITTFVNLDDFKQTSQVGRMLSESMFNELFIRDFNVVEFRGQIAISINSSGEYFISRDINKIKNTVKNKYILIGTYSTFENYILLNARIIDNENGNIVASAREHFSMVVINHNISQMKALGVISEKSVRVSASKKI